MTRHAPLPSNRSRQATSQIVRTRALQTVHPLYRLLRPGPFAILTRRQQKPRNRFCTLAVVPPTPRSYRYSFARPPGRKCHWRTSPIHSPPVPSRRWIWSTVFAQSWRVAISSWPIAPGLPLGLGATPGATPVSPRYTSSELLVLDYGRSPVGKCKAMSVWRRCRPPSSLPRSCRWPRLRVSARR